VEAVRDEGRENEFVLSEEQGKGYFLLFIGTKIDQFVDDGAR